MSLDVKCIIAVCFDAIQILCIHHGTQMRHEIAGEPIIEEEQEMVAEKVVSNRLDVNESS